MAKKKKKKKKKAPQRLPKGSQGGTEPSGTDSDPSLKEQLRQLQGELERLKQEPKLKDKWDKWSIVGAICIPVAIAVMGSFLAFKEGKRAEAQLELVKAQNKENDLREDAAEAMKEGKLVESLLGAIASKDPLQQRIALETLRFAAPTREKTIRGGIRSGASQELTIAINLAETEFERLKRESADLVYESNTIFDLDNELTDETRLRRAKLLIESITESFPEMITPSNSKALKTAGRKIDAALEHLDSSRWKTSWIMKFYIRHSIANIEIDERKVNDAIAEWGKLKSAIDSFLLAAKRYQFDPSSKSTVDAAFSTLRSEFLTRTKAGDDPPRLLRILEQRVYPTIVLMDMTLTIGDLR